MATTNLNITQWSAGQAQPEVTIGTAIDILDGIVGMLTHNMASDADYTLATTGTEPFEWQYGVLRITDTSSPLKLTTTRSIIVPTYPKWYLFKNETAQSLTLKKSGGTGITVATGKWALLAYTTADADVIRITPDA